jgi:uncharacterized membrane protein
MRRFYVLTIIILLLIVGFALRLYRIDVASFRGDEAFTVLNWVRPPLTDTLAGDIPSKDPQPPLAYAIFHIWARIMGEGEFTMRLLPALVNLLGIPALYALGRRMVGWRAGLMAALFWALHPYLIWHSQDARNYAIWSAFSLVSLWLAIEAIWSRRLAQWVLYVFAAVLAAYVYYLELFTVFALNLYVLYLALFHRVGRRWSLLVRWGIAQAAMGLLLAPWFLQERLLTSSGYAGTSGGFELSRLFTWFLPTLISGNILGDFNTRAWVVYLLVVLVGLVIVWRIRRDSVVLLVLLIVVPVVLLSLVSTRLNVFEPRYILSIIPALLLVLGTLTVAAIRLPRLGGLLSYMLAAGIVLVYVAGLGAYYFDYTKSPDWREVSFFLTSQMQSHDLVIQSSSDIAFTLYFGHPENVRYLPANPAQSEAEIRSVLNNSLEQYQSFWVIGHPPSGWDNAAAREEWLTTHMQFVYQATIGDILIRRFMPWLVSHGEIDQTSALAEFEEVAYLAETFIHLPVQVGQDVYIWVYWQPLGTTSTPLKAFMHLVDATGQIVTQDDHYPQDGRISSTTWAEGNIYRDVFALHTDGLAQGSYALYIGLYNVQTGERVALTGGQDSFNVGSITLP